MDPAQEIELNALRYQEPMNAVIERGDSSVQQFYRDATVFLTGGSGFIGKQLIEKLFRSCAIKKLFILLRSKKGKDVQERLNQILNDPLYDLLRSKQPDFAKKIVPVEGDVADLKLGLSYEDWTMLTTEVDMIIHSAATIIFNAPLATTTLTNVRGTRESIALAKQCSKLKSYVYVSTAFCHATEARTKVLEQFYPCPISPEVLISLAEQDGGKRLDSIGDGLIEGWPNTYTFSKAVAEELVRVTAASLPTCIIRPPLVLPAYYEPGPGWLDVTTINGPTGVFLATGLGILNVFRVNVETKMAMAPLDYVNNTIIAAPWDASERRKDGNTDIPIYIIAKKEKYLAFKFSTDTVRQNHHLLACDKALWYNEVLIFTNKYLYWFFAILLHYIPAYAIDGIFKILGKKPPHINAIVDIYKRLDKFSAAYDYYANHLWDFGDQNLQAMIKRMSDADKAIYNCDLLTVDLKEFIFVWSIGIRKYIVKDGLVNTNSGYKKQKIFRIVNYVVVGLYFYALYWLSAVIFSLGRYFFSFVF
ncbi:fatty acyl-CoA reductase wat-like [Anticarsia gemmatalis]|uniref:fatty acyl-CoA reductase wat-like n=1 Tax=Anticarsia gemmatalis TaxID=129554 RepID=UPI003F76E5B7